MAGRPLRVSMDLSEIPLWLGYDVGMSSAEIDEYIAAQPQVQREMLEHLRATILDIHPDAQQLISYALPAFKVEGVIVAGMGATKSGISYYPHSGSVLGAAGDAVSNFSKTKGAMHVPAGEQLSRDLVAQLIQVKLALAQS